MSRNRSRQATPGRRSSTPSASTVHKRMTQGDPEALAIYHDFQDSLIGPDPRQEGG